MSHEKSSPQIDEDKLHKTPHQAHCRSNITKSKPKHLSEFVTDLPPSPKHSTTVRTIPPTPETGTSTIHPIS